MIDFLPKYIAIMLYFDACTAKEDMTPENLCTRIFYSNEQEDLWEQVDAAHRECINLDTWYFHFDGGAYVKGA